MGVVIFLWHQYIWISFLALSLKYICIFKGLWSFSCSHEVMAISCAWLGTGPNSVLKNIKEAVVIENILANEKQWWGEIMPVCSLLFRYSETNYSCSQHQKCSITVYLTLCQSHEEVSRVLVLKLTTITLTLDVPVHC